MGKSKNDILQGTLTLLLLKTLDSRGPLHGYALTSHIHRVSRDLLRVEEGSLYPALHRMERKGWIASEWGLSENNRRAKYYQLTDEGRRQLEAQAGKWSHLVASVGRVLETDAP